MHTELGTNVPLAGTFVPLAASTPNSNAILTASDTPTNEIHISVACLTLDGPTSGQYSASHAQNIGMSKHERHN